MLIIGKLSINKIDFVIKLNVIGHVGLDHLDVHVVINFKAPSAELDAVVLFGKGTGSQNKPTGRFFTTHNGDFGGKGMLTAFNCFGGSIKRLAVNAHHVVNG